LKTQENVVVKTYTCRGVNPGELRRQMESVMEACEEKSYSGLCPVIGVSADNKGRVSVLTQHMEGGLRNFINNHRDYERVSSRDQLLHMMLRKIEGPLQKCESSPKILRWHEC
jgi:hypothetical protein